MPETVTAPRPRSRRAATTHSYTALAQAVREAGLTRRARWFYALVGAVLVLALGGVLTGVLLLDASWLQLLMAAALGVVFTQVGFLAHEASHRQVLASGPANDRLGRLLATLGAGISYSWWMDKHNRHHANPNRIGKDPDVDIDTVSFHPADAATRRGLAAWVTRRQGWLFFPLLTLEGVNLHLKSLRWLVRRDRAEGRWLELGLLALRAVVYLGALFWLLPVGMAFAFLGVQLAVFGFYLGASFAPNHVGMPVVPRDTSLDFLSKQVLTSRNVAGGWWMTALMGGLNYQVEHHLFPNMPRPHLARTRRLVRDHCRSHGVPYTETSLLRAWARVARYLNEVGLAAPNAFRCPVAVGLR